MIIKNIFEITELELPDGSKIPVEQKTATNGKRACIIRNLPDDIYHEQKQFWGSSMLRSLYRNSREFKYGEFKVTKAMELGTAFHSYFLEPENFAKMYKVFDENKRPDTTKGMTAKDNKAWKAEFYESNNRVITNDEFADFCSVESAMYDWQKDGRHPIQMYMKNSEREVSVFIEDYEGLPIKIRIDILVPKLNWLGDLKTTANCSSEKFYYAIKDRDYDAQLMLYKDVYEAVTGKIIDKVFILACELSKPYNFNPIDMKEWEDSGRLGYMLCIDKAKTIVSYNGYVDNLAPGKYFNEIGCTEYDKKRWVR